LKRNRVIRNADPDGIPPAHGHAADG